MAISSGIYAGDWLIKNTSGFNRRCLTQKSEKSFKEELDEILGQLGYSKIGG